MNTKMQHPKEQIVSILNRIYHAEMTNLSGGNLSIRDGEGNLWITPAGVDKGNLSPDDIICVNRRGISEGKHKPSSELPFHQAIYAKRTDLHAIVHAHPPGLIAYSIAGTVPETRVTPHVYQMCHPIGYAPYAMTGSEALGKNIALTFAGGFNIAMLENHGVVCGGGDLLQAYQRLESLEICARTLINAEMIGEPRLLSISQLESGIQTNTNFKECDIETDAKTEKQIRLRLTEVVRRGCERQLLFSSSSVVSVRINQDSFLITPRDSDLCDLGNDDFVLIKGSQVEGEKFPSKYAEFHRDIYGFHPEINSVITSHPPHAMAFALTGAPFVSHTIPECYVMLHDVPMVPFDAFYNQAMALARRINRKTPVVIIQNDCVVTTGSSLMEAFDRLEILEFSARSLVFLPKLGKLRPISDKRLREIREKFFKDDAD